MKVSKFRINKLDVFQINTTKFKTMVAGVIFTSVLTKNKLAEKILLSSLLTKTCQKYPKEQEFSKYLKNLYDTNIFGDVSKRGKTLQIMFGVNIVNERYLDDCEDLLKKTMASLQEVLLNPYLVDQHFSNELLEKEKRLLIDEIKSQYNNKRLYAVVGLINNMFKKETYQIYSGLTIPEVESITPKSLLEAYQELLDDSCYGFVIGDSNETNLENVFRGFSKFTTKTQNFEYIDYESKRIETPNEVIEEKENNQSVLAMGYRTNIHLFDKLYYPMCVMNGMLGGFFHSTLLEEVREKASLAYYIVSEYVPQKGFLAITSGIDAKNYDETVDIIKRIVNDYQQGNVSENNFKMTKETLINGMLEGDDSLLGLLNDIYRCAEHPNKTLNLKYRIKKIEEVTLEEIVECSKTLQLDTIFMVKGQIENGNEEI